MNSHDIFPLDLTTNTDKLKEFISMYPDYPIVFVGNGKEVEYGVSYVSTDVSFSVGEILDAEPPYEPEHICSDRQEFEEDLESYCLDIVYEKYPDLDENERNNKYVELYKKLYDDYEKYWKKVIIVNLW